ncbi:hypothetical protein OC842_005575 [Tilletia horrida]|uniref:Uncharacterized protein n=1 Tax=Tilletia horrida TaxID=155126 RepID=A0AAN6G9V0_9BASI|nr:hypothetical protein OC842_005575 [Tilletia horrida]
MAATARRWTRRQRNGSTRDDDVDEGIWDRNDTAFLNEIARSRQNSVASTTDIHEYLRSPTSSSSFSPTSPRGTAFELRSGGAQGSRQPSFSAANTLHSSSSRHTGAGAGAGGHQHSHSHGELAAAAAAAAAPIFRMPFQPPTTARKSAYSPQAAMSVNDLRRPSIASTLAGGHSPPSGAGSGAGHATPSRTGVLSSLKRMVSRRRGSKKSSDSARPASSFSSSSSPPQGSPILNTYRRRPSQLAELAEPGHFSALPPSTATAAWTERIRSPQQIEHELSRALGAAIDDVQHYHSRRKGSGKIRRDRQRSAPMLNLPPQYAPRTTAFPPARPPSSPGPGFAAWAARGSFSGITPVLPTADVSPTRQDASLWGDGTPPPHGWVPTSPLGPARRRVSSLLGSPPAPLSAPLRSSEGGHTLYSPVHKQQNSGGGDLRPMRPRRSEDLQLGLSQTDQDVMSAFNDAHGKRWSAATGSASLSLSTSTSMSMSLAMERRGSGSGSGSGRRLSARRKSDASHVHLQQQQQRQQHSLLFSPHVSLAADTPSLSPNVSASPATISDGYSPVSARPGSAQEAQLSATLGGASLVSLHAAAGAAAGGGGGALHMMQRRRSLNPFDGKRLSVIFPSAATVHAGAYGKTSPVTPSSISRPLSVCSSTFDSVCSTTNTGRSYTPSFATSSLLEPSLPSPRTHEGKYPAAASSSLYSVSDTQEELEAPRFWQQQQQQQGPGFFMPTYALKRPSSSSTTQSEFPASSSSSFSTSAHQYQQYHAGARWGYPSSLHSSQRHTPAPGPRTSMGGGAGAGAGAAMVPRPKSATFYPSHGFTSASPLPLTSRPATAVPNPKSRSRFYQPQPQSQSQSQPQRRRPSFGLSIAPAAAAAFDSIPAPGMAMGASSPRRRSSSSGRGAAARGSAQTKHLSAGSLAGGGKRSTRSSVEETTTEEDEVEDGEAVVGGGKDGGAPARPALLSAMVGSQHDVCAADAGAGSDVGADELFVPRRPVSDAPITPDLNGDLDDADEFDFGLADVDVDVDVDLDADSVAGSTAQLGAARLSGSGHPLPAVRGAGTGRGLVGQEEDDDSSALELLADDNSSDGGAASRGEGKGPQVQGAAAVDAGTSAEMASSSSSFSSKAPRGLAASQSSGGGVPTFFAPDGPSLARHRSSRLALLPAALAHGPHSHGHGHFDAALPAPTYTYL